LFAALGTTLKQSAGDVFKGLPPDEPQGGDKDIYIDALISRVRSLIGDAAYERVLCTTLDGIVGDIGHGVLRDRKALSEEGVVVVIVTVDTQAGEVVTVDFGDLGPAAA